MNVMATDLRMVTEDGVISASPTSVTIRVPFAFGMLCREPSSPSRTIASLMPVDSMIYASSVAEGAAIRQSNGSYTPVTGVTAVASTNTGACTADSIRVVPGGRLVELSSTSLGAPGTLFYLYQSVRYRFGASGTQPGRRGLFRLAGGGVDQELLAPFASDAGFGFLAGTRLTLLSTPPSPLSLIEGLELRLVAESRDIPSGQVNAARFALRPRVKFVNH